jgi:hypothetical protein
VAKPAAAAMKAKMAKISGGIAPNRHRLASRKKGEISSGEKRAAIVWRQRSARQPARNGWPIMAKNNNQ